MSDSRLTRGCMVLVAVLMVLFAGRTARGDAYSDLVRYDWDQSRLPLATIEQDIRCLLYTSPSPRDRTRSRMPSSA